MNTVDEEFLDTVGINAEDGNQYMGINLKDASPNSESKRGCRLVWSRLGDLGSLDPGSNPGSPISITFHQFLPPQSITGNKLETGQRSISNSAFT